MLEQFTQIGNDARTELANITDAESLEAFRIQYLGRKGSVTGMLSMIGKLPKEQKREGGQLANTIKQEITQAFEAL
ncbi:MAG: phenylalanine--tRNA ligase subunit alpha, partial [Anaerohalosphaeraceae bacterium]